MAFYIREPNHLQEVFALSTPQHMLNKLFWEIGGFKRARVDRHNSTLWSHRDAGFSAFNTAVTAVHCADWAWEACGADRRGWLGNKFNFKPSTRRGAIAFSDALETVSRDFFICRRIANGSKHMRRGEQGHSVRVSIEYSPRTLKENEYLVDYVIRDGETLHQAEDVFDRMAIFWDHLYREIGFIEDRYVDASD